MNTDDAETELRLSLSSIDDSNELAWHILDFGLMHDSEFADLISRAAAGRGEKSRRLAAMLGPTEEVLTMPTAARVAPPMPAKAHRPRPMPRRDYMRANPFARPQLVERQVTSLKQAKLRSAVLTSEAGALYNCLAFAMREYGVIMNGHITVTWQLLGVKDHVQAAAVLTEFNARMRKWLGVDASGRRRKGAVSPTYGVGEPYYYAYVHENASTHGFHTHQLFHVSDGKARAFAERAVTSLARLTGTTKLPAAAVVITPGTMRDGFAPYLPRFKRNEEERCWVWFRYLAKNLSPHEMKQVGDQCALQRSIFRIRPLFTAPPPVMCSDVFGCSENIGVGAQKKAGFVSSFDNGNWMNLYRNYDLDDYRRREQDRARRAEVAAIFEKIKI